MEASAGQILSICFSAIDQSISFDVLKLSHFVLLLYLHVFTLVTILAMVFIFPFFFLRFVTGRDARTKASLVSRSAGCPRYVWSFVSDFRSNVCSSRIYALLIVSFDYIGIYVLMRANESDNFLLLLSNYWHRCPQTAFL